MTKHKRLIISVLGLILFIVAVLFNFGINNIFFHALSTKTSLTIKGVATSTSASHNLSASIVSDISGIRVYVDEKHKIVYCSIPKNACTMFRNLLYAVLNEDIMISHLDVAAADDADSSAALNKTLAKWLRSKEFLS